MLSSNIEIKQLVGVGDVQLNFEPNQQVYCLIGENGIGKTKCLEALFFSFMIYHEIIINMTDGYSFPISFKLMKLDNYTIDFLNFSAEGFYPAIEFYKADSNFKEHKHNIPMVFLGAKNRGGINNKQNIIHEIGNQEQRIRKHRNYLIQSFSDEQKLHSMSMDLNIQEWIIQRAQSANPYQAKEDNREVEITTLLTLLNKIDDRINDKFLEIAGDNKVFIKVSDKKTELSELSSGFASLLKIIQSIIAGFSYFTNETNIAQVKGVVFIDEIESHLHTKWQANIIPTLKRLFPNTTFYISTHSAIVISQLQHGEAYELYRDSDDVVKTKLIEYPNSTAFIDLLKNAFDIDMNQLKLARDNAPNQQQAKKALLALLDEKINQLEVSQ